MPNIEAFLRYVAEEVAYGERGVFRLTDSAILAGMGLNSRPKALPASAPTPSVAVASVPRIAEGTPMNLPDVVKNAVQSRLAAEQKPISDTLARLRATLDAYEARAIHDAERRVSNAMLTALGEPPVEADPAFEGTKKELQAALLLVATLIGVELRAEPEPTQRAAPALPPAQAPVTPPQPQTVTVVAPEPVTAAIVLVPPPSSPGHDRKATEEDIALAKRLIAEVEVLRTDAKTQHQVRLHPLLQAITAEVRLLLDRLPEDNYLHVKLSSLIPVIGALKAEGNVEGFVRGLAFGSSGDWARLSFKNRRKVELFDRDAAVAERRSEPKPLKSKKVPELTAGNGHEHPNLPLLHQLTKPILLAGGIIVQEKIRSVHDRFGLKVEWHEIDHDNPRASGALLHRVRAGKVGAIVLLEGVMRHSTYASVVDVCTTYGVPYAMGDKAGIASLQSAFADLERKLSTV